MATKRLLELITDDLTRTVSARRAKKTDETSSTARAESLKQADSNAESSAVTLPGTHAAVNRPRVALKLIEERSQSELTLSQRHDEAVLHDGDRDTARDLSRTGREAKKLLDTLASVTLVAREDVSLRAKGEGKLINLDGCTTSDETDVSVL